MGAVFLYFSLDEVATLHESITGVLERFEAVPRFAGEHGIWIWVHGLIGLAIPAWVLPGLIPRARAKPREAIWFAVGGGLMVLGGVVVEVTSYFVGYLVLIEETLEIVGASLMLWATYRLLENTPVVFSADPSHA